MLKTVLFTTCLAIALLISPSRVFSASIAGLNFTGGTLYTTEAANLGYEFTPTTNIFVTHLGYYDPSYNPADPNAISMIESHPVAIYNPAQAILDSATVVPTDTLVVGNGPDGYFRFTALASPLALSAGVTYRVAGFTDNPGDGFLYNNITGLAAGPDITVGQGYFVDTTSGNPLAYPSQLNGNQGGVPYAAGNFLYVVPEPSSMVLLGMAAIGLLAVGLLGCRNHFSILKLESSAPRNPVRRSFLLRAAAFSHSGVLLGTNLCQVKPKWFRNEAVVSAMRTRKIQ